MRVDPSKVAYAYIRPPVFSTLCLYQITWFRYSSHSCTIFLHSSYVEMNSFLRPNTYTLYSFIRRTYPCAPFVHASHHTWSMYQLRVHYIHLSVAHIHALYHIDSSPFMYQPRCLYPLASCLLYHIQGPIPPCLYLLLTIYQVGCLALSQGDTSRWV